MKLFFILLTVIFMIFPANDGEKFAWSEDRKLSWDDFRGTPAREGGYVASTNSGISFSYSIKQDQNGWSLDYTVRSNFYPNRSWYLPEFADAYILAHEQTHFDISELHARKFREQLSEVVAYSKVKDQIDGLYAQIEQQRRDMQQQYDLQTDHSKIREKEYQWRDLVRAQLALYNAWK